MAVSKANAFLVGLSRVCSNLFHLVKPSFVWNPLSRRRHAFGKSATYPITACRSQPGRAHGPSAPRRRRRESFSDAKHLSTRLKPLQAEGKQPVGHGFSLGSSFFTFFLTGRFHWINFLGGHAGILVFWLICCLCHAREMRKAFMRLGPGIATHRPLYPAGSGRRTGRKKSVCLIDRGRSFFSVDRSGLRP